MKAPNTIVENTLVTGYERIAQEESFLSPRTTEAPALFFQRRNARFTTVLPNQVTPQTIDLGTPAIFRGRTYRTA